MTDWVGADGFDLGGWLSVRLRQGPQRPVVTKG